MVAHCGVFGKFGRGLCFYPDAASNIDRNVQQLVRRPHSLSSARGSHRLLCALSPMWLATGKQVGSAGRLSVEWNRRFMS